VAPRRRYRRRADKHAPTSRARRSSCRGVLVADWGG